MDGLKLRELLQGWIDNPCSGTKNTFLGAFWTYYEDKLILWASYWFRGESAKKVFAEQIHDFNADFFINKLMKFKSKKYHSAIDKSNNMEPWLFVVHKNFYLSWRIKKGNLQRTEPIEELRKIATGNLADSECVFRNMLNIAEKILKSPDSRLYKCWRMSFFGHSLEEISNKMGLSIRTVRRDRDKAKKILRDSGFFGEPYFFP